MDRIPSGQDQSGDLPVGCWVELRVAFTGAWAPGFRVERHDAGCYWIQRNRDGAVLPRAFQADEIRLAGGTLDLLPVPA